MDHNLTKKELWNFSKNDPALYLSFKKYWFKNIDQGLIFDTEEHLSLPKLPIVVYECGTYETSYPIKEANYISFDKIQQEILNPSGKLNKKQVNNLYHQDKSAKWKVRKEFNEAFNDSVENNDVTVITTTSKISPHTLPFISPKHLNIVTGSSDLLLSSKYEMTGKWSSKGIFLIVFKKDIEEIVNRVKSIRNLELNPPKVTCPQELPSLFNYWIEVSGSIDGMKNAITSFYDISINVVDKYYNFSYKDKACYDDPFNKGCASPASFCRGTAFYYNDEKWELARLPMNRGKEIAMNFPAEDVDAPSIFYSEMVDKIMEEKQYLTAKVDGTLLIVFKDKYKVVEQDTRLQNSYNVVFGTKALLSMHPDLIDFFIGGVKSSSFEDIESFAKVCDEFMEHNNLLTLCFEIVSNKRGETVIDYTEEDHGMYFLGASSKDLFKPYFLYDSYPTAAPTEVKMTIKDACELLLGPFNDHLEGSVIWVKHQDNFFPLKLKTKMYYLLHKRKNDVGYYDYLLDLVEEYGWIGKNKPTYNTLPKQKLVISLFSLVNYPNNVINAFPDLRESRKVYQSLLDCGDTNLKFKSTYIDEKYWKAYELI